MTPPRINSASTESASARAQEIRKAAETLFLAKGYASTTMNDIAQSVGILPGSLYHHFVSKEAVAVEILDSLNKDMQDLPDQLRLAGHHALSPEDRLRDLTLSVVQLGLQHSAAVRLRAFNPPTVASDRFRAAISFQSVGVQRLWRTATNDLRDSLPDAPVDSGLLTVTMQVVAAALPTSLPSLIDPKESSRIICDALLSGIITNCPADAELNTSAPLKAARSAVSTWTGINTGDATKDQILDAARREFASRGYAATTIRDVADASGVWMGSIYRRTRSMDAMFEEIAYNYATQLDNAMRTTLEVAPSDTAATLDALAYVIAQARKIFRDETRMLSLSWNHAQDGQPQFMSEYRRQVTERMGMLEAILAAGQESGSVRRLCSPGLLAHHLRSILWAQSSEPGRIGERRQQRFLRSHLLRGIMTSR